MNLLKKVESAISEFLTKRGFGIRAKLIIIFVIMVIPLAVLTFIEWGELRSLAQELDSHAQELKNFTESTVRLGFISGIMIVLVVLIAIWVAHAFSSRITNLVNGISKFRAGERQFRFNTRVKDEIGVLADSFDEMADSLVEADRGFLVYTKMDLSIIYANDIALHAVGTTMEDILGRNYFEISVYPANTEYDPVKALHEGRESHILYHAGLHHYYKGEASYLTEKDGNKIGYIITSYDVTELMEQQKTLETAIQEANLANQHKDDFLARMSHEIRTPLNAVIGMTGIVKRELSEKIAMYDVSHNGFSQNHNEVLHKIEQIETSSHHLLGLLNDILDISKIEAGKIELSIEEMNLMELAQTVASIIQSRCDEKNISFETSFELPENKSYLGDALRLRQVLINLLGNAVKFTAENGKVSFIINWKEKVNEKALIDFSIRDTGIGIAQEAIANLFKPFEQADKEISQKYGGTGLGLAISRSIVQLFDSDIAVKSRLGEGSEFSFTLALRETEAKKNEDINIDDVTDRLKGKRALVVDDVDINRTIVTSLLEVTGLAMDEADNGENAVKAFSSSSEYHYDIIYMDVQMPVMNGYEAARAIRALDRADAKTVPIIALTANAFKDDIDKAIASGMNSHLAKPVDFEKLMEVSFRVMGNG